MANPGWNKRGAVRALMVSALAVLALLDISHAFAVPILGVMLTNTTVVDPDGAGPLSPFPLAAAPGTVSPGGYIRHDAAFSNIGPDPAASLVLSLQMAAGEFFVGALATGGVFVPAAQPPASPFVFTIQAGATGLTCTVTGNTLVTCVTTGGVDLPAGASGTLTVFSRVDPATSDGTVLTSNASIVATGASAASSASTTVAAPVLGVTLSNIPVVDPDGAGPLAPISLPSAPPGSVSNTGYVRYNAAFANTGGGVASNTSLTVQLPSQTLFVGALATGGVYVPAAQPPASPFTFTMAAGATSLNCTVTGNTLVTCIPTGGSLPGGVSGTLTVFAKVQPSTVAGTVLSATANITPPGPNATSVATITVAGVADLSVTNVDTPDPLIAGGNITYTITVTNGGPSVATGVGISFPLDANTTFVSSVGPPCMTPAVGTTGTVTCTVAADLAPLGQVVLTVIANVNPAFSGIANATATVSTTATDLTPGNNSAIASTTVQPLTFPVTGAVPYGNGTIYCPSPVQFGTTTTCTLTPVTGATVASVSGCGGVPGSSLTYTTGPITAACTVTASFVPPPIPTLGEAMLLLLGLLLAGAGVLQLRRKT